MVHFSSTPERALQLVQLLILTSVSNKVMHEPHAQLTYCVVRFMFFEERLLCLGFQHFPVEGTLHKED